MPDGAFLRSGAARFAPGEGFAPPDFAGTSFASAVNDDESALRFIVQLDTRIPRDPGLTGQVLGGLRMLGDRFAVISANSRDTAKSFCLKLRRAGLDLPESRVFLAGEQTLRMVGARHPGAHCLFSTSRVLSHAARRFGLVPVQRDADVVLVGRDTSWTYQRLELLANEVAAGAAFYATNREAMLHSAEGRLLPDTGAMVAALEAASGVKARVPMGDPPLALVALAQAALGCEDARTVLLTAAPLRSGSELPAGMRALPVPCNLQDWTDLTRRCAQWPGVVA